MRASVLATASAALTLGATFVAAANKNNNNVDSTCISTSDGSAQGLLLAGNGTSTVLVTSPSSPFAVHRLASSFAGDIRAAIPSAEVSVRNVSSLNDLSSQGNNNNGETWIFLGALDSDPLLNAVVNATSIDVSSTRGQWEAWTVDTASWEGREVAVIAGADRRGAAYAAYTLSEQMGVSPWWWWADVPTQQHDSISLHACSHGSPVVKYRAIFLNDEQPGLTNWANKQFHKGNNPSSTDPLGQSFTVEMYEKMFDLLLRLKANMIWPAMWADMFAVAGLPEIPGNMTNGVGAAGPNQVLAGEMAIIEWNHYSGPWNYTSNKEELETYWKYGADRAAPYETLFTVGMRGNGDIPLSGISTKLLEKTVADQRNILKNAHPDKKIEDIPQMWCMYKEVQGYFDDDGLEVPDDVTLLWTDDNWSNIRRVPTGSERNRTGGAGLYWHHDYVGQPRNYKWISTINFAKTWEQFNVAQTTGMDRILVINVGDFKPIEVATEFALHLAYEGTQSLLTGQNSSAPDPMVWTKAWAARTFPNLDAKVVATVVQGYNAINAKIKPELVNSTTWSLTMQREAELVEGQWDALTDMVYQLQSQVSPDQYPAFYQLVGFPALASANLNKLYIAAGRSNLHGSQARTSASYWADQARKHFARDAELTNEYHSLLDYKWDGMMSQPHLNQYYWQQNMRNTLPQVTEMQMDAWPIDGDGGSPGALLSPMRITIQGSKGANPGDNVNNCPDGYNCPPLTLPSLSRYSAQPSRWIDVSSGSWVDFAYNVTANVSWITLTPSNGSVGGNGSADCRVEVSVNWDAVPANATSSMLYAGITFAPTPTEFSNSTTVVLISVDPSTAPDVQSHKGGFVQGEPAYIAMHATNATRMNSTAQATWTELPGYGLTGTALTTLPPTHPNATAGTGPVLEFDFYALPSLAGKSNLWNVTVWLGPFYNYRAYDPFQFALQLDDGPPTVVQPVPLASSAGTEPPDWNSVVSASIRRNTTSLPAVQDNKWHTLKVWSINAGMVLEMVTIGAFPVTSLPPPQSCRVE
ncbi:hypothetical protein QFC21_007104 [Naganishia friedmannii]|uniref:Uncharacterized protein n=1 Tax=Naganishia friedmannii TaxID=89922 RepID=A0ACC2UYV7_9TREE|nr:hypothetical protein QFC21_007104 [Naganishia friedmannii]